MGKWELSLEFSTIPSFFEFLQATSETNETDFFPSSQIVFWDTLVLFLSLWENKCISREVSAAELLLCDLK